MNAPAWFFWLLIGLFVASGFTAVLKIGKPRPPLTNREVLVILCLDATLAFGVFLLVPHS